MAFLVFRFANCVDRLMLRNVTVNHSSPFKVRLLSWGIKLMHLWRNNQGQAGVMDTVTSSPWSWLFSSSSTPEVFYSSYTKALCHANSYLKVWHFYLFIVTANALEHPKSWYVQIKSYYWSSSNSVNWKSVCFCVSEKTRSSQIRIGVTPIPESMMKTRVCKWRSRLLRRSWRRRWFRRKLRRIHQCHRGVTAWVRWHETSAETSGSIGGWVYGQSPEDPGKHVLTLETASLNVK